MCQIEEPTEGYGVHAFDVELHILLGRDLSSYFYYSLIVGGLY